MYLFGARLVLADRLGVLPASASCPVASCGAALSGSGLGGVLADRSGVLGDSCGAAFSCGASWICGASGVLLSWGVVNGTSLEERVPSPEGGVSTSVCFGCSMQGL